MITCLEKDEPENVVFMFENADIFISHVVFDNESILGTNSNLTIRDSTFRNSQIYLMDKEILNNYSQRNFTRKSLDARMLEAANGNNETNRPLQCSAVILSLQDVEWDYGNNDDTTNVFLDSLIKDGIQAICHNVSIDIVDSMLADKQVFVYAVTSLDFKFIRSTFVGLEDGRNLHGGIKLNSFVSPSVLIEDSSISTLLFSNFFYAIFSAQQYITAVVYLRILAGMSYKAPDPIPGCTIRNTNFTGNFRALNFEPNPNIRYSCHVTGSNFVSNHVLTDGGAVVISGDVESLFKMTFTDCYFEENQAGSQELDFPEEFPIKIHQSPGITITSFEETEEESLKIYMELQFEDGSEPVEEFVFLDVSGSGGALFVGTGSVHVANSRFVGNTAAMYGGAIHVVIHGELKVSDTVFYSPDFDQELEDGTLMSSFGKRFILENVELNQVSSYASEASVFFHEKDGYADTAEIVNISILCPINSQINSHNVSLEILKGTSGDDNSPYLTYKELWYDCLSCEIDTYSLDGGYFQYTAYPNYQTSQTYNHQIIYDQIDCHDCSFGGYCADGNIYPKVHHWGVATEGAVTFYNCPGSYCCSLPVCEDHYDACGPHRVGNLCGRCGTNYSEAMFSSACIPNENCHATWMFPVTCALAFIYAMFLLFQNDLKDFLVAQPKPKPPATSHLPIPKIVLAYHNEVHVEEPETGETKNGDLTMSEEKVRPTENPTVVAPDTNDFLVENVTIENNATQNNVESNKTHKKGSGVTHETPKNDHVKPQTLSPEKDMKAKQDEGGIFLILLFYYFQDSSIVFIRATYANVENQLMLTLKDIAGSLFKFRIDLSVFVSNDCIMADVTPVIKIVLKLVFQPALFSILIILAVIAQGFKRCSKKESTQKFGSTLSTKTASGMVFAILFSYQTVASSMFALIHCVNVNGNNVLFVDGNIACYQSWQIFTLIAIAFCLIPFSFYIMLAPGTLIKGRIDVVSFFTSCFCAPIVSTFLYIVHKIQDKRKANLRTAIDNSNEVYVSPEAKAVYRILQGPYREYSIKFCGKKIYLCWSGMLLARRLMLILCDTFIYDLLLRVSTNYHCLCYRLQWKVMFSEASVCSRGGRGCLLLPTSGSLPTGGVGGESASWSPPR